MRHVPRRRSPFRWNKWLNAQHREARPCNEIVRKSGMGKVPAVSRSGQFNDCVAEKIWNDSRSVCERVAFYDRGESERQYRTSCRIPFANPHHSEDGKGSLTRDQYEASPMLRNVTGYSRTVTQDG